MRYLWGACSPSATTTSVRTSTSSTVATRPADVGAAACAQHWLTTPICAPSMGSTSTSDRKSLSAVSQTFSFPSGFKSFQNKGGISNVCVEHCIFCFILFFIFTQVWCVLEACCTAPACPLVGGPAALCLAWRRVTLTTVPRGVAAQTAAITMMCASAVCNCESSPSSYIILIVVIHCLLSRITHANMLANNGPNTRRYCQFMVPFFTGTIFGSTFFLSASHKQIIPKNFTAVSFWRSLKAAALVPRGYLPGNRHLTVTSLGKESEPRVASHRRPMSKTVCSSSFSKKLSK